MKKWIIAAAIFVLGATEVLAQSGGNLYNQAVNAGSVYRSAYAEYVQAKNQHLQYNTASTRVTAIDKTNKVLVARNQWLVDYLKYIRQSLADVTNIINYPQTVVYLGLETQINSLSNLSLGNGVDFNQINTQSQTWEKGLEPIDRLAQASQLQIASTRLVAFQGQLAGYLQKYQQDHASPSASQLTTLNLIQQKLNSSVEGQQQVDRQLSTYRTSNWSPNTLIKILDQSRTQLLDATKLLNELTFQ